MEPEAFTGSPAGSVGDGSGSAARGQHADVAYFRIVAARLVSSPEGVRYIAFPRSRGGAKTILVPTHALASDKYWLFLSKKRIGSVAWFSALLARLV